MVSVRDMIFNEDKVWDRIPIQCTFDEIKVMDKAIKVLQLSEIEIDNVQLEENVDEEDVTLLIAHQNNQEAEDLNTISKTKNQIIDNNLA